jgi:hypothetical protein
MPWVSFIHGMSSFQAKAVFRALVRLSLASLPVAVLASVKPFSSDRTLPMRPIPRCMAVKR